MISSLGLAVIVGRRLVLVLPRDLLGELVKVRDPVNDTDAQLTELSEIRCSLATAGRPGVSRRA
jgi:hypothetical protein